MRVEPIRLELEFLQKGPQRALLPLSHVRAYKKATIYEPEVGPHHIPNSPAS